MRYEDVRILFSFSTQSSSQSDRERGSVTVPSSFLRLMMGLLYREKRDIVKGKATGEAG